MPRIKKLAHVVGGEPEPSPHDVIAEPLEAARALAKAVNGGDDLASQLVLCRILEIRRPCRLENRREAGGIGRVADDVGLEVRRLDLRLQPGEDDLVLRRASEVFHPGNFRI